MSETGDPWPARSIAETLSILTAPGASFEMQVVEARGRRVRAYVNAKATLRQVLDESRRFGAREFLVFEDERLTFEGHWRAASAFGRALSERLGVAKGDRVAIAMRNYPEWSVCAWGALAIGAVVVPLNALEPGPALARMLRDCGARVAVVDPERLDRLAPALDPQGDPILLVARAPEAAPGLQALSSLIGPPSGYGALPDKGPPAVTLAPDDLATIFYTSGTTGQPKGAFGTHRNVLTNLVNTGFRAARAAVRRGAPPPPPQALPPPRKQLLPLPLFHVTGFHSALAPALANGVSLVLMYRWNAEAAVALIERERIQGLTLVPTQAWQLVDALAAGGRDMSSVDTVGYGGAAAPSELAARVREVFPVAFPGQGYGATETSSLVAANSHEDMMARPGSVGVATPCCDLRVVDEHGRDVGVNEPGELWIHGPQVVLGYWNAPEATAAAFPDGWYRTGDIVRLDAEGFITVLDRAKDMLIRGGENIYCVEIEDVLMSHPAVAEAAVMGVPDRILGETVGALVRLKPGRPLDPAELARHAAERLPAHKAPVVLRLQETPFPRNAAGKVLKRELREALLAPGDGPWPGG